MKFSWALLMVTLACGTTPKGDPPAPGVPPGTNGVPTIVRPGPDTAHISIEKISANSPVTNPEVFKLAVLGETQYVGHGITATDGSEAWPAPLEPYNAYTLEIDYAAGKATVKNGMTVVRKGTLPGNTDNYAGYTSLSTDDNGTNTLNLKFRGHSHYDVLTVRITSQ